ncbi:PREDICTED: uncharacterized protein LOC105460655, partial [Wasmannia auropunctata]|uniref:uncharacterized protein LOC105460655 n=1 Tax=Wasmannia auropunctata TaxID=64793 RepID=UPI0005F03CB9
MQSSKCTSEEVTNNTENEEVINIETVINDISNIIVPTTSSANIPISKFHKNEKKEREKCKKCNELMKKQYLRFIIIRKKMKALRYKNKILESKVDNDKYKKAMSTIFNEDQVRALLKKVRIRDWLNETVQRALKLKFICGISGYEELLRQEIPLPSLRTLSRKLEDFKFELGISNQMFEFLKLKKSSFNETDFECGLIFDEMAIISKKCYNPATGSLVGDITS